MKKRNVTVVKDLNEHSIVLINDICFKGRRNIEWNDVEIYLKQYVGEFIEVIESKDIIYIGNDLADEYTGSKYTEKLKGTYAKAKANAAQGIPELVEIATNKRYKENFEKKHSSNAKYGWYRYDSRFALAVYDDSGEIERYNVFHVELLIRHAANNKLYLYDIVNIKKETSTPLQQNANGQKLISSMNYNNGTDIICQEEQETEKRKAPSQLRAQELFTLIKRDSFMKQNMSCKGISIFARSKT